MWNAVTATIFQNKCEHITPTSPWFGEGSRRKPRLVNVARIMLRQRQTVRRRTIFGEQMRSGVA